MPTTTRSHWKYGQTLAPNVFQRSLGDAVALSEYTTRVVLPGAGALPGFLLLEGDSITEGNHLSPPGGPTRYSDVMASALGITNYVNYGVASSAVSNLVARAGAADSFLTSKPAPHVLTILIGAVDMQTVSAATFVASVKSYAQARQAAGWEVILMTVLPQTTTGFNAKRNSANALIRADPTFYDRLVELATDSRIGLDACAADPTYYMDGLHPTDAGNAVIASLLQWAVGSALTGTTMVPTGTDPLLNGDNLQAAINAAAYGDTLVLQAGASYQTRVSAVTSGGPQGVPFSLPNKGANPGGLPITIRSSGTPALPAGRRITPAAVGSMAQIATNSNAWTLMPAPSAGWYTFVGIDFTNTANVRNTTAGNTIACVYTFNQNVTWGTWGHDLAFDRCWFHPEDEVSNPTGNFTSMQEGVAMAGANISITNSRISGFYGFAHSDGSLQQSMGILMPFGPGPYTITNNYIESYGWNMLSGGSAATNAPNVMVNPANTATVSNVTSTSATFSQVATLAVGDVVAIVVPIWISTDSLNVSHGNVFKVDSINTNSRVVTYHGVGQDGIDVALARNGFTGVDPTSGNTITNSFPPPNGSLAQWRGLIIDNVTVTKNTFAKKAFWVDGRFTPPKALWEIKDASHVLFEGNIAEMPGMGAYVCHMNTGFALSQEGNSPWQASNSNIFRHNIFRIMGRIVHSTPYQLHSGSDVTGTGLIVTNNLWITDGAVGGNDWFETSTQPGGTGWTVTHNTVLGVNGAIFADLSGGAHPVAGMLFRDNLIHSGQYYFNGGAVGYPSRTQDHNLVIKNSTNPPPAEFASDTIVTSIGAVGFVNYAGATAGGDYHGYALSGSSAYKGTASDGVTDPGVNFAALDAALVGNDGL